MRNKNNATTDLRARGGGGGTLLFMAALLSLAPLEQSQAQLYIHVYPSQDSPTNQTLWIFSGSSSTSSTLNSIRSSGNYNTRDSWLIDTGSNSGNIYNANRPNNQLLTLSSLLSSTNSKDIASVNARIPGGGKTNITFAASATNTPTITIAGRGTRTIANLWMDEDVHVGSPRDGLGIRIQAPNLLYSSGEASSWVGAGLIDKPIGDFYAGTFNSWGNGFPDFGSGNNVVQVTVNNQIIPEPEEYALIFGLFALGFVFFHRRMQKKKRQTTASPLPF